MTFTYKDGVVSATGNRPGNHATLFASPGGTKLPFRGDLSSWDNATSRYTWAFDWLGGSAPPEGTTFVFAVADWDEGTDVVEGGSFAPTAKSYHVIRQADGKPVGVAGI